MTSTTRIPSAKTGDSVSFGKTTIKPQNKQNRIEGHKRLSTPSVPSKAKGLLAAGTPSGSAQPGRVPSHSVSMDPNAKKRADLFAKSVPHDESFEKNTSRLGWTAASERSDGSAGFRNLLGTAIPAGSPSNPDMPNSPLFQWLGMTTAENTYKGIRNMGGSAQAGHTSLQIGDKTGMALAANDFVASAAQTVMGVGYAVIRTNAVGSAIVPSAPPLAGVTPKFAEAAGVGGTVLYGLAAVGEAINLRSTSNFMEKYQAKKEAGKVAAYLRKRLGVDVKALRDKALKGKTAEDLEKEGLAHLRPLAKRNIALLQKHGKLLPIEIEAERVDRYIYRFLGGGKEAEGRKVVKAVGQNVLLERLKAKKWTKMGRILGDKAFKEVIAEVQKPAITTAEKRVQNAKLDRIVLGAITPAQSDRKKKIALYIAGAVTTAILAFLTGGGWIVGLLLAAAIVYAIVALGEFYFAHKAAEEQKKIVDAPPGRYDWLIASAPGLLISAGTLVLLGFVSMGTIPLVLGVLGATLMLARSIHNAYVIHERRQNYCQHLMEKKGAITLDEFAYLAEYMPEEKLISHSPIGKLPKEERKAINRLLEDTAYGLGYRQKLLEAIKRRREQQEKALADALWGKTEDRHWLVPGMIPGMMPVMHPTKRPRSPKEAELD